ncbi:TPA: LysE family translocator [Candidatus Peregrinibacteria bacterium]|nr:LysE family translocator [Candidatus Peregrinibacteria bacterium]
MFFEYIPLIASIAFMLLLALVIPGPDFFMVVRQSLQYSRKTGIYTAIGLGLGIAVHITYCLAGIALIISKSILLFNIIKIIGAIYLFYIGFQVFLSKADDIEIKNFEKKQDISSLMALKVGFLTNVLNPKATLFFMSMFTVFIPEVTPNIILAIISIVMILMTIIWFICVSLFFTQPKVQIVFNKFQKIFNKIFGGLLMALGVKIAVYE